MKVEIKCKGSSTARLDELKPLQGNLKDLSDKNYEKLKNEILELGFSAPFFCWSLRNGEGRKKIDLLDGHQRLIALTEMSTEGIEMPEEFPIVDIDAKNKKEAMKKVLAISSNYGTMTKKGLQGFMNDAGLEIDEVTESFTFDAIDFEDMKDPETEDVPPGEDDDVPEVTENPTTRRGDVWLLGKHRVMCGDSTMIDDVEKLMNGEKADMVFTDPPYGMYLNADYSGMKNDSKFAQEKGIKSGKKHNNIIGDHNDFTPELINTVFANFSYCKEVFLWGADYYAEHLIDKNDGSWIVWDKRVTDSFDKMYGSAFELCWSKNKHKREIARIRWASAFGTEQEFDHKRHHPTQKPHGLVQWFFEKWCENLISCVDLFMGSGSTLIACEKTNRKCYGMELDEKYCDVIIKRWQEYTGKEAVLESTGQTYEQTKAER